MRRALSTFSSQFSRLFTVPVIASLALTGGALPIARADTGAVTLRLLLWNNPPTVAAISQIDAAFAAKYPNISVELTEVDTANDPQAVATRLAANGVDIFAYGMFNGAPASYTAASAKPSWVQYIEAGQIMDLTGQPFLKHYYPAALANASTYKGKIYSFTTGSYAFTGVFYNKALFKQYGLAVPTTFNQLMAVAASLKSHGVAPFISGGKDTWPLGLITQGVETALYPDLAGLDKGLWTGNMKFTDPTALQVFVRTQKILQYMQQNFMGVGSIGAVSQFAAGHAAMLPSGTWDGPSIETANPALSFGYFPLPGSDNPKNNAVLGGKYDVAFCVANRSVNKDAALKWMAFVSEPANYARYVNAVGIIPAQPGITLTDPFLKEVAPLASTLKLAPELVVHQPSYDGKLGTFQFGKYAGFQHAAIFLAPAGPIASPAELAASAQRDWSAGVTTC